VVLRKGLLKIARPRALKPNSLQFARRNKYDFLMFMPCKSRDGPVTASAGPQHHL